MTSRSISFILIRPLTATAITTFCCGNESGAEAESQITAFEDTWHWNIHAEETYSELINEPGQVGRERRAFEIDDVGSIILLYRYDL